MEAKNDVCGNLKLVFRINGAIPSLHAYSELKDGKVSDQ